MIKKHVFVVLLFPLILFAQQERYPVFDVCKGSEIQSLKDCFYTTTKKYFFSKFKSPRILENEDYSGTVNIIFEVTSEGEFKLIYVHTPNQEIRKEVQRVFSVFPKITPAWYNNHAVEMKFEFPIKFSVNNAFSAFNTDTLIEIKKESLFDVVEKKKLADSTFLEHHSKLNIPFTHKNYVDYEFALHKSNGTHSASKPYTYSQISKYYNLSEEKKKFLKPSKKTWTGNKIWNEHLLQVKKNDYWFTVDFLFDGFKNFFFSSLKL